MTLEVGFLLVLPDVMPVGPRVNPPVESRQIVPGKVLTVFRELDAEPLVRTPMQAGKKSFDHGPRLQLHRAQPGNDGRVEEAQIASRKGRWHLYIPLLGRGTASSSRSTRLSAVIRSDSA